MPSQATSSLVCYHGAYHFGAYWSNAVPARSLGVFLFFSLSPITHFFAIRHLAP